MMSGESSGDRPSAGHNEPNSATHREERRSVEIHGSATLEDGSLVPVVIVNLSYDGCAVETPVPLKPGTAVRLVTRIGSLEAEVRWCSNNEAGLHFHTDSKDPAHIPRESECVPVALNARMRRRGKGGYGVPVSDLSNTGCILEFADRPDIDEVVSIRFDGLSSIEATVRWIAGCNCGVDFIHPIHPAILEMLLQGHSGAA